jgi:hypothetical protein
MALFSKSHYIWLESFFRDELRLAKQKDLRAGNLGIREKYLGELIISLASEIDQNNNGFDKQRFLNAIYNPLSEEENKQYQNFSEPA